jgi:hypothetical protein
VLLRPRDSSLVRDDALRMAVKKESTGCIPCAEAYKDLARKNGASESQIRAAIDSTQQVRSTSGADGLRDGTLSPAQGAYKPTSSGIYVKSAALAPATFAGAVPTLDVLAADRSITPEQEPIDRQLRAATAMKLRLAPPRHRKAKVDPFGIDGATNPGIGGNAINPGVHINTGNVGWFGSYTFSVPFVYWPTGTVGGVGDCNPAVNNCAPCATNCNTLTPVINNWNCCAHHACFAGNGAVLWQFWISGCGCGGDFDYSPQSGYTQFASVGCS